MVAGRHHLLLLSRYHASQMAESSAREWLDGAAKVCTVAVSNVILLLALNRVTWNVHGIIRWRWTIGALDDDSRASNLEKNMQQGQNQTMQWQRRKKELACLSLSC
jgi:hypothetical protein